MLRVRSQFLGRLTAFLIVAAIVALDVLAQPVPMLYEPSLSPDGERILFVAGGDLWSVSRNGGEAMLIHADPAQELRPLVSPDGERVAFMSTRSGNGDIYVMHFANGEVRRLTFDDDYEQLDAWSSDGKWVYFSTTSNDIAAMSDIYRVPATGGTPRIVLGERYLNEFAVAPAPTSNRIVFNARSIASRQWWRRGHSHLDEAEIWLADFEGDSPRLHAVTERGAKRLWPMWSPSEDGVFYVSDEGGAENLWFHPFEGRPTQQTNFNDGRLLWPHIAKNGQAIVFERDFRIWLFDIARAKAEPVPIQLRGAASSPNVEHKRATENFDEMVVSPDGKKMVLLYRGDLFATAAQEGGNARRVTDTAGVEYGVAWSADSNRIVYVSERDGRASLYFYDFRLEEETRVSFSGASEFAPRFSPDGNRLAFVRDGKHLVVRDLEDGKERVVARTHFGLPPILPDNSYAFSPDSRHLAYVSTAQNWFRNVEVVSLNENSAEKDPGPRARPVSFLANVFSNAVAWHPDGDYLLLHTGQRTEPGRIARIDLVPRTPEFREDSFDDLFDETDDPLGPSQTDSDDELSSENDPSDDEKEPAIEIDFEGIRKRLTLLPLGLNVANHKVSSDGGELLVLARAEGQQNLYAYSLAEGGREAPVPRQLTSTSGRKSHAQFDPVGKRVFYLENGRPRVVSTSGGAPRNIRVTATVDIDFDRDKQEVFRQAWSYLRHHFFDADMNGLDWDKISEKWQPYVLAARTPSELRRLIRLMVGELNASHLGVSGPLDPSRNKTGRIGLSFDPRALDDGRFVVSEIVPLGPAAVTGAIQLGDSLVSIDGRALTRSANLRELQEHRIGERIDLVFRRGDVSETYDVTVKPVNRRTMKSLVYRSWVEDNRSYVERASGGRLGYVHMLNMSGQALSQLHLDLDASNFDKDGVVIDLRNNSGGFVNAYALDVFARKHYLNMSLRGLPTAPARSILGQRSLGKPTVLITNQHSLSDAEDFTEGYRALGVGKVVGEPTSGWIIYTWGTRLVDGSMLRLPRMRVTDTGGRDMEMAPRPVDIAVTRPVGESANGRDSQLDAAVETLLKQLDQTTDPQP